MDWGSKHSGRAIQKQRFADGGRKIHKIGDSILDFPENSRKKQSLLRRTRIRFKGQIPSNAHTPVSKKKDAL